MARTHPRRLPAALAVATVATLAVAAPALGTEGPVPPGSPVSTGLTPLPFSPFPGVQQPNRHRAQRVITRARIVPRRVRRGQRARLKLRLTAPMRVRVTLSRRVNGRRVRTDVLSVLAKHRRATIRLPGRALRPDRYRVRIVAIDGLGVKSIPVRRALIVRKRR